MNHQEKTRILNEVSGLLDRLDKPEDFPVDLFSEQPTSAPDMYSVVAGMTAVAEELRIQGKTFKKLCDKLSENTVQPDAGATAEQLANAREQDRSEVVSAVLELHDRLKTTHSRTKSAIEKSRKLYRLLSILNLGAVHKALLDGLELTLSRFDRFLDAQGIICIGGVGSRFDPNLMKAVGSEADSKFEVGRVAALIRHGYRKDDKLLQSAEVIVAK